MGDENATDKAHAALMVGIVRRGLEHATDDQLHAEWMRRHPNQTLTAFGGVSDEQIAAEHKRRFGANAETLNATREAAYEARDKMRVERDEWKRKHDALMTRAEITITRETGPGIAAMPKRDDAHYVDPWDFLEDA